MPIPTQCCPPQPPTPTMKPSTNIRPLWPLLWRLLRPVEASSLSNTIALPSQNTEMWGRQTNRQLHQQEGGSSRANELQSEPCRLRWDDCKGHSTLSLPLIISIAIIKCSMYLILCKYIDGTKYGDEDGFAQSREHAHTSIDMILMQILRPILIQP